MVWRLKRWRQRANAMTIDIAFLGAGRMGYGMITNLHKAGHRVTVYNRSLEPLKALADIGIRCAGTPAEAAAGANFVMSMVTDDKASSTLWEGPAGALEANAAPGAVAIESSTVSVRRVKELSNAASRRGLAFLDCPVAGRPAAALAGSLTVFAGGAVDALERARPVLSAISHKLFHFGPSGSGIAFKLLYNAVGATQIACLAEAMAACRMAGLDLAAASQALSEGGTGSPHVKLHAAIMASGQYSNPPAFTPAGRIKDLEYAIELMAGCGVDAGVSIAALSAYEAVDPDLRNSISDTQIVDFLGTSGGRINTQ
jgi:3-hydroxyisobutyrate dehydrogenase